LIPLAAGSAGEKGFTTGYWLRFAGINAVFVLTSKSSQSYPRNGMTFV
jgi:hypothetical protein